jgi:hypothetical protein
LGVSSFRLPPVVYDAWLSKGGGERRVELQWRKPLVVDDVFTYDREIYKVTALHPGNDEFVAVIAAEWQDVGRLGTAQFIPDQ